MRVLLLFVSAIAMPAVAQPTEAIRAAILNPAGPMAPGCVAGVFQAGEPVAIVSTGLGDSASGRAIDAETMFYSASVSKQFTALALMQLVAAGRVGLGDPVRRWIPELPDYGRPLTVAMLVHHTSGIRDSLSLLSLAGHDDISQATRSQAMAAVLAQRATKFEPGTRYDYTNGGYLLLAEIVERASGEPFPTYVARHILTPLGMSRSLILDGRRPDDSNVARGYRIEDGRIVDADNYPLFGGSGGLVTTLTDLARWDREIDRGGTVWTPEIRRLMLAPGTFNNGAKVVRRARGTFYASGLQVGPNWFGHGGGARGFKTYYARLPAQRLGIALLCNRGEVEPADAADAVRAAFDPSLPSISEPSVPASALDGQYGTPELDAVYRVAAEGDKLRATVIGPTGETRRTLLLQRTDEGSYRGDGLELVPDDDGRGLELVTPRVRLHLVRETQR